jgi:hypothetical protein
MLPAALLLLLPADTQIEQEHHKGMLEANCTFQHGMWWGARQSQVLQAY